MALIQHPTGDYLFLPGIAPYSCGVVAAPGFEIVHVTLHRPLPYRAGFERIEQFLAAAGRPKAALCAIELRSPRPFSFAGFAEFNAAYAAILKSWGLFVDGRNPVARTNVAPEVSPPPEPALHGFSYTRPDERGQAPTFVVAGSGELPEGVLAPEFIVARGDTSPAGIRSKASFVLDLMENRLLGLGVGWSAVTDANLYTIHSLDRLLPEVILRRMGLNSAHWHYTRPPIEEIEFEMDLRGVRNDVRLLKGE
jgi:hypothetical protein